MARVRAWRGPYELKRITGKAGLPDGFADEAFEPGKRQFLIGTAVERAIRTVHNGMGNTVARHRQAGFASVVKRDPRSH